MPELPHEIAALSMCASILDELWNSDKAAASSVVAYLLDRYQKKWKMDWQEFQDKKERLERERADLDKLMAGVRSVHEADVLGCLTQQEDGSWQIDKDLLAEKRKERFEKEETERSEIEKGTVMPPSMIQLSSLSAGCSK